MKDRSDSPGHCYMAWRKTSLPRVSVGALEVGRELTTQLHPGGEGPLVQVHESRSGRTGQGHKEVVDHDDLILSCSKDRGGVDL
jgi:hypothetical protein